MKTWQQMTAEEKKAYVIEKIRLFGINQSFSSSERNVINTYKLIK
jgi:hypothetical protein